jgi:hypothetical protein
MATGSGKGIEWMINLDARTGGATDVIQALGNTSSAADKAGRMIDQALAKMEGHKDFKQRIAAENTGWDTAIRGAKQRVSAEENVARSIKNRTAMLALETHELEKTKGSAAEAGESMFGGMLKAELAMEGIKKGAELVFETIKKTGEVLWDALKAAGGSQRTGKVFENMLGKEGGKETLEYLDKFSDLSEFTGDVLKPMAATLLQVGVRGADFRNAIAAASDVAASSTDKVGAFAGAIESFTRIARTGRVDNRILGGLALNPHDVEAQLSKDLHLAPETIKKKLEEGTLKGVEAMDSIITVMEAKRGKQLGLLDMEMADNFDARLDKLRDVPDEIFKKLKDTKGFEDISDAFAKITKVFSPESDVGKSIISSLSDALGEVGTYIKGIDWNGFGKNVAEIVADFKDLIEPLKSVADLLGGIAKVVMELPRIGHWLGESLAESLDSDINKDSQRRHDEYLRKQRATSPLAQFSADNAKGLEEVGGDAVKRLGIGMSSDASYDQAYDVGKSIIEGGRDALQSKSPSRQDAMDGFRLGIEDGAAGAQSAASSAISPPSIGGMMSSVGAGGGGSFTIASGAISIQMSVGGSGGSPQEIGKEAADQTASALLPLLEQFAIQAGLA